MAKQKTKIVQFEDLRPTALRIMGREYRVEYLDATDMGNALGLCMPDECRILVRDGQPEVEEVDTLLHETMHALFALLDIDVSHKKEEEIVRRLATGLIQVFKDSPEMLVHIAMAGTDRKV